MIRLKKADYGCGVALLIIVALIAGVIFWLWYILERHPMEGWQEGPHTPEPTTSDNWTPFPSAT
ncbi:hypothetical protein [Actinomadura logoneensis]|uniref:hypothetical protein n=1 Tax=Actinomadura logoneensis TaxID=2293572 RepID=UPI0011C0FF0E|nr:hypothetical protein [Actinomadura logoneensis]